MWQRILEQVLEHMGHNILDMELQILLKESILLLLLPLPAPPTPRPLLLVIKPLHILFHKPLHQILAHKLILLLQMIPTPHPNNPLNHKHKVHMLQVNQMQQFRRD